MLTPISLLMTAIAFGGIKPATSATDEKHLHPQNSGHDCEGIIGEGTVAHNVYGTQFFSNWALICCHPTECDGGQIVFCTVNNGTDECAACPGNSSCNYKRISSTNLFKNERFCTDPCTRKNAVPDVVLNPTSYTKQRRDTLTLQPTIYSDPEVNDFIWMFKNSSGSYYIAGSTISISNQGKYAVGPLQNPYLNITNIHLSDAGAYQLIVRNAIGVSKVTNVTLNVTGRPIVTMVTEVDNVDAGSTYRINCSVIGKSITSSMTFKGSSGNITGISVDVLPGGIVTHTIHNATVTDSGYYTCTANNSEGSGESTMLLTVETLPTVYSSDAGKMIEYEIGENISVSIWVTITPRLKELGCHRSDDQSKTMLRHLRHNTTTVGATFNFSMTNIQTYDAGEYVCTATNRLGSNSIFLNIVVKPVKVPELEVSGKDDNDCTWFHGLVIVTSVISAVWAVVVLIKVFRLGDDHDQDSTWLDGRTIISVGYGVVLLIAVCWEDKSKLRRRRSFLVYGTITAISVASCVVASLDMTDCSPLIIVPLSSILGLYAICFVRRLLKLRKQTSEQKQNGTTDEQNNMTMNVD